MYKDKIMYYYNNQPIFIIISNDNRMQYMHGKNEQNKP